jgi:flagellar biogenesis protein FliO
MIDADLFLRFVLALAVVLALIAATGWVGRRYMGAGRIAAFAGKRRRLALLETLQIDSRTRLFLVRRDTAEHLIMVGAAGAVVVERGVTAPQGFAAAVESAAAGAGEGA